MEFKRVARKKDAIILLGNYLSRELIHRVGYPTLLLLSGGPSLAAVEYVTDAALHSNLSIGQTDEVWTSEQHTLQAAVIKKNGLVLRAEQKGIPFVPIHAFSMDTVEESARSYEQYLKQWRSLFRNSSVIIAVLDFHSDGGIAGLSPREGKTSNDASALWYATKQWVIGYVSSEGGIEHSRITLSPHFIRQEVDHSFVLACGEDKRDALESFFAPEGALAETPSRVLHDMRSVILFSDIS